VYANTVHINGAATGAPGLSDSWSTVFSDWSDCSPGASVEAACATGDRLDAVDDVSGAAAEGAGVTSMVRGGDAGTASPAVTGTSMFAGSAARPLPTDAETDPLLADRDALVRTASASADPVGVVTPEAAAVDAALRGVARGPAFLLAFDPFDGELDAPESVDSAVSAMAIAGIDTTAAPTPRATARAPTRPTLSAPGLRFAPEPLNELTTFLSGNLQHSHFSGASHPERT